MSFTSNMPTSGQTLGKTRPLFVNNFFSLRSSQSAAPYGVGDHMDVNNGQYPPGRHKWVRMPDVGADFPAAAAGLLSLYVRDAPDSEIYYREPGGNQIKITNDYFHIVDTAPVVTYDAYTLPIIGGLMMKIGMVKVAASMTTTFNFVTVTGSDFVSDILYYTAGNFTNASAAGTAVTTTTFDVANGVDKDAWFSFLAIGI